MAIFGIGKEETDNAKKQGKIFDMLAAKEKTKAEKIEADTKKAAMAEKKVSFFSKNKIVVIGVGVLFVGAVVGLLLYNQSDKISSK